MEPFAQSLSAVHVEQDLKLCLPGSCTHILHSFIHSFIQQALTEHTVWPHGNRTVNTQTQVPVLLKLTDILVGETDTKPGNMKSSTSCSRLKGRSALERIQAA